jgi:hypothetical protein
MCGCLSVYLSFSLSLSLYRERERERRDREREEGVFFIYVSENVNHTPIIFCTEKIMFPKIIKNY